MRGLWRLTAAGLAIVLVAGVALSDFWIGAFWTAHPMLTAIVSALAVVLLSVAVIEAVLSRRAENRWRVLAQSALIELAEAAYATWSQMAGTLGLGGAVGSTSPGTLHSALTSETTGPKIRHKVEEALLDSALRSELATHLTERNLEGREILARWAVALTGSESYVEIFDQHVELYARVDGLSRFLNVGYRLRDPRGRRDRQPREYRSPGGEIDDEWFVNNVVTTLTIAARLEDATWDLALAVLPEDWWDRRTVRLAAATRPRR